MNSKCITEMWGRLKDYTLTSASVEVKARIISYTYELLMAS